MDLRGLSVLVFLVVCCDEFLTLEDVMFDNFDEIEDSGKNDEQKSSSCPARNSICGSLMKTSEREDVIDEGELCKCPSCVRNWGDKKDKRAITWHHQERRDFLIQYRLCAKILPDDICEADDRSPAVKITTGVDEWKPRVAEARCKCKDGIFNMAGWWRKKGRWEYSYTCNMPTCNVQINQQEVCFKQYKSKDNVITGVQFPCGCPYGFKCPLENENTKYGDSDENGDYSVGFCVPLPNGD